MPIVEIDGSITIDWGSTTETFTNDNFTPITKTYGSEQASVEIEILGDITEYGAFSARSSNEKLTYARVVGMNTITDSSYMFYNCINLTELDIKHFDVYNVINMNYMFANCIKITNINCSRWNTRFTVLMNSMFANCQELIELKIGNFDTVMFKICKVCFHILVN